MWERAAHLQAEAARRVEAPDAQDTAHAGQGYALTHVRSAALEAGIADEFVDAALADIRAERALPTAKKGQGLANRFLGHPPYTITVRRVLEATPREVLTAMEAVFLEEPFRLTSVDQRGNPLDHRVLVFDIQGLIPHLPQNFALEAKWSGIRQVFVSLRSLEGGTPSCEMTVHSPVTSHNISLIQGLIMAGFTGGAGLGMGVAVGALFGIGPLHGVRSIRGLVPRRRPWRKGLPRHLRLLHA